MSEGVDARTSIEGHSSSLASHSSLLVPPRGDARVPQPALFVDRDGTVTVEGEWIVHPGALELVPGASRALVRARDAGYRIVMYTNQSAGARGMITEARLEEIHDGLLAMLARDGAGLDGIYSCPHHPTEGVGAYKTACECRKPEPGLIRRAARELNLDLARSWCVGDMMRDLEAGAAAGVPGILVATGKGTSERARLTAEGRPLPRFEPDVAAAIDAILTGRATRDTRP